MPLAISRHSWLVLALLALTVLYAASAPIALPDHDAAEFATVAVAGGIPHPSGYPLYCLLLRCLAPLRHWFP